MTVENIAQIVGYGFGLGLLLWCVGLGFGAVLKVLNIITR